MSTLVSRCPPRARSTRYLSTSTSFSVVRITLYVQRCTSYVVRCTARAREAKGPAGTTQGGTAETLDPGTGGRIYVYRPRQIAAIPPFHLYVVCVVTPLFRCGCAYNGYGV